MALNYQIALTSVWWNDDYQDVRRFSSAAEQKTYFKLDTAFLKAPFINFDIKDLMRPRIVFKEPNKDVFDVLNANYLIVKDNHASSVQKYFFYFIDRIRQDSGDIYIAECKLDVWQTFFLIVDFGSGMIERAHLPRFTYDKLTEKATIDFSENSPLLVSEHAVDVYDKILKYQAEANIDTVSEDPLIKDWIKKYVKAWVYIFVDMSSDLKFYSLASNGEAEYKPLPTYYGGSEAGDEIEERFSIIYFPLLAANKGIRLKFKIGGVSKSIIFTSFAFNDFLKNNNGYTKIFNMVISPICPINLIKDSENINASISGNVLEIEEISGTYPSTWDGPYGIGGDFGLTIYPTSGLYCLCGLEYPAILNGLLDYDKDSNIIFNIDKEIFDKSEIVDQLRQIKFEPKFRQAAYTTFSFDIMHVVEKEYNFIINPAEFSVIYSPSPIYNEIKIYPKKTRYYNNEDDNFSVITFQDFSVPIINSQLEQYIANNKSWARIGSVNPQSNYDQYANANFFAKFAKSMNIGSAASPLSFVGKMIDAANEMDLEWHKPEDLKAAPSIVKNSTAAVLRILAQDQVKIYYKIKQVPEATLLRDLDYYYWFGYKYGYYKKFADIMNSNGRRKYFNYILGSFNAISGDINDAARRELRDLIAKGVRIWEVDKPTFDDTKENYEIYFDED